ncbi:uncharacterized protein PV06_00314 [Exophiala oligosperma]|uniref:Uncharacterized protein n=1 Tax=Exophiala oligosperma TaxID=215243 RepID=A0A0D2DYG4_9EURO|nr:uncharacterized protein PV06_00314 [Exophiala oligosperma]KIW47635.1 hypothetical protein PV06_00314 [Exophiala oligosperma]
MMPSAHRPANTQLVVEDEEPTIEPRLYRYITSLDESPACYTRFFDALLIQRDSRAQFFHDLKTFREQPTIITLLEPGSREGYRTCTQKFVTSRFAHPWCRINSDFQSGWSRATWVGATKKVSKDDKKEEERLHRLLVPIWIAFHRRMFPDQVVLDEWIVKDDEHQKELAAKRKAKAEERAKAVEKESDEDSADPTAASTTTAYPELGFKMADDPTATSSSSGQPTNSLPPESGATTASQVFLGAAIGGFIMSDKRVMKYVKKKFKNK